MQPCDIHCAALGYKDKVQLCAAGLKHAAMRLERRQDRRACGCPVWLRPCGGTCPSTFAGIPVSYAVCSSAQQHAVLVCALLCTTSTRPMPARTSSIQGRPVVPCSWHGRGRRSGTAGDRMRLLSSHRLNDQTHVCPVQRPVAGPPTPHPVHGLPI